MFEKKQKIIIILKTIYYKKQKLLLNESNKEIFMFQNFYFNFPLITIRYNIFNKSKNIFFFNKEN